MKLLLLTVCCVISTSLAGPFSDKEEKLEAALNDIELVLQDLHKNEAASDDEYLGDIPRPNDIELLLQDLNKNEDDEYLGDIPRPNDIELVLQDLNKNEAVSDEEYLGDIPRPQSVFREMEEMLLHSENIEMATAEIESLGGRVAIQLGNNLLIANIPADVASEQDAFAHASAQIPTTASAATHSNAKAYEMYREDKLGPQPKVQKWTKKTAPKSFPRESPHPADSPYTQTMRGKIAVVLIGVSGPGSLALSISEYIKVYSEVMRGLKFWTDNAPASADLSFVIFGGKAIISASNGPVGCSREQCHDVFAIPAYQSFGFSSKDHVAQWAKDKAGAVGSFVAFFSKYRQIHFAYADIGGGPIYMQYSNGNWGTDEIDAVFAHETGHVFNAPDEYGNCNCYVNYGKGTCTDKNINCAQHGYTSCGYNQQSCIMDSNDLDNLCIHSKRHVGWC